MLPHYQRNSRAEKNLEKLLNPHRMQWLPTRLGPSQENEPTTVALTGKRNPNPRMHQTRRQILVTEGSGL